MTAGAQDIHRAVDDFAHDHMTPIAAALGRCNGSARAHSSSVRSLG
jgi:hypothetical protein